MDSELQAEGVSQGNQDFAPDLCIDSQGNILLLIYSFTQTAINSCVKKLEVESMDETFLVPWISNSFLNTIFLNEKGELYLGGGQVNSWHLRKYYLGLPE